MVGGRRRGPACATPWLLALVVALATADSSRITAAQVPPAGEQSPLRGLAERLLSAPLLPIPRVVDVVQLLPGELPEGLPLAVPVPPGGRLVGSAVRGAGGRTASVEVVLAAPGTVDELLAYYRQELGARGWNPPPSGLPIPGGIPAPPGGPSVETFCDSQTRLRLLLTLAPTASEQTAVQVSLTAPDYPTDCDNPRGLPPQPAARAGRSANVIPMWMLSSPLSAPPGVQAQPLSSGATSSSIDSRAELDTDQGVKELEAQFAAQLQAAGWTRQAGGAQGPLAWSTWQVPGDADWRGLLLLAESPRPNRRLLSLRLQYLRPPVPAGTLPAAVDAAGTASDAPLRELAERLLTGLAPVPAFGPQGSAPTVQLLPGELPPELPLALPVPPDGRLVGSAVRGLRETASRADGQGADPHLSSYQGG
ncbi:MAG TPA: hypothetical protein VFE37_07970, partial [Chloroflexota bacterium]|nr:hypothetical protein [Chloroflexota bacterium]